MDIWNSDSNNNRCVKADVNVAEEITVEEVSEKVKLAVRVELEALLRNAFSTKVEFPSSLSAAVRDYIHRLAADLGLSTKSIGSSKYGRRFVAVFKRANLSAVLGSSGGSEPFLEITSQTKHDIAALLQNYPVTQQERAEISRFAESFSSAGFTFEVPEVYRCPGRLNSGVPQVPPPINIRHVSSDLAKFRTLLPVFEHRSEILQCTNSNQICMIVGETGCGKTTQIPQYLLEEAFDKSETCKVICTQPRRIAAVAVAERVAEERGEALGDAVGYQIRLESRVSPHTLLTFCTNGVLLRTLTSGDDSLSRFTHIILDEIHERDMYADMLLMILRDLLPLNPNVKLICLSANVDVQLFKNYFKSAAVYQVPSCSFAVQEYFLEQVLEITGFVDGLPNSSFAMPQASATSFNAQMDACLTTAWYSGLSSSFDAILRLVMNGIVPVDYQHSESGASALMIACGLGYLEIAEKLQRLGASFALKAANGRNALDWAKQFCDDGTVHAVEDLISKERARAESSVTSFDSTLSLAERSRLEKYGAYHNANELNLQLVLSLLQILVNSDQAGSILVFLPGHDDVMNLRDAINSELRAVRKKVVVFALHSSMPSRDLHGSYAPVDPDLRKIILVSNIAETSISITDVAFVIDTGKTKQRCFDVSTNCSRLVSMWISKANAEQRRECAGRSADGICYHLFSRGRFDKLCVRQLPEMLRLPIHEVCLLSKLLAPKSLLIADTLSQVPEPPLLSTIQRAVQMLKAVDALDDQENLTELGQHLSALPVEPQLGKMILYSVFMKCLDPVLTIVSCLSYKDPFVLPKDPSQKSAVLFCQRKLAQGSYSDHMVLLRAFQAWQKARTDGNEALFCERSFVSSAVMEGIMDIRTRLLGQLRATGLVRSKGANDIRDLNMNSENWAVVKAALLAGSYPNIAFVNRRCSKIITTSEKSVYLHPTSVLTETGVCVINNSSRPSNAIESLPTDWILYHEKVSPSNRVQLRYVTSVSSLTVALFGGHCRLPTKMINVSEEENDGDFGDEKEEDYDSVGSESDNNDDLLEMKSLLKLDEFLCFRLLPESASFVMQIRLKWNALLLRRLKSPAKAWTAVEEAVLQTVVKLLSHEEQTAGLTQPTGIGQRPKPMGTPTSEIASESMTTSPVKYNGISSLGSPPQATRLFETRNGEAEANLQNGKSAFVVLYCRSFEQVKTSMEKKVFATNKNIEADVFKLFRTCGAGHVVIFFTVEGSNSFQGYGHFVSTAFSSRERIPQFLGAQYGNLFQVNWTKRADLTFASCRNALKMEADTSKLHYVEDGQVKSLLFTWMSPTIYNVLSEEVGNVIMKLWQAVGSESPPQFTNKAYGEYEKYPGLPYANGFTGLRFQNRQPQRLFGINGPPRNYRC